MHASIINTAGLSKKHFIAFSEWEEEKKLYVKELDGSWWLIGETISHPRVYGYMKEEVEKDIEEKVSFPWKSF